MPERGLIFRILVASPSDCIQERKAIPEIIYSWNAANSLRNAAILEPVLWETHATPAMGDRPQAIINKQLVKQCDLLIGVFWTRLGTNTGVAESGTAEEIEEFRKDGKPVLLYFSSVPVIPDSIDQDQYKKLVAYKKDLQDQGIVFSYDSVAAFRELLQRHLASTVGDLLAALGKSSAIAPAEEESDKINAIRMFKSQFESFLRRFEADWTAERDAEPHGIDDGKYILRDALSEVLSFKSQIVKDDGQGVADILQNNLMRLKELGRHELYLDGGVSYREFWAKGDEVLENLKKIPMILKEALTPTPPSRDPIELPPEANDPFYRDLMRQELVKRLKRAPTSREVDEELAQMLIKRGTDYIQPEDLGEFGEK